MNRVRVVLAGMVLCSLVLVAAAQESKKDDKKTGLQTRLLGTWEVTDGKGLPPGSRLHFAKDGKLTIIIKRDEAETKNQATYTIEGESIKTTVKRGDEERTQTIKVTRVDDKQLVLEGPRGDTLTFKKVVEKGKDKEKK